VPVAFAHPSPFDNRPDDTHADLVTVWCSWRVLYKEFKWKKSSLHHPPLPPSPLPRLYVHCLRRIPFTADAIAFLLLPLLEYLICTRTPLKAYSPPLTRNGRAFCHLPWSRSSRTTEGIFSTSCRDCCIHLWVRFFFSGRNLHSRMPLDPTHVRLKRTCV
jgi:hypothetical protein